MDWISDHLWQSWLVLAVVLGVAELVSLDLILVMLAGGALVAAAAAGLGAGVTLSVVAALVTSVALLGVLRPSLLRSLHSGPDLRTGHELLIGQRATVTSALSIDTPGRIKVGGEDWSAVPYDESEQIAAGEVVEVVEITGVTARVLRLPALPGGPSSHQSG